jgi:hypothetical protein
MHGQQNIPLNTSLPKRRRIIGFSFRYFYVLSTDVEMCLAALVSETGRMDSFNVPPVSAYACC